MDNQVKIKNCDSAAPLLSTEDHPLVTFAIFAYNQERYIREAVEAAFAQSYSPLEIILSDDCSSDRTYEIMESMAGDYNGIHRVLLNRTKNNCGTIDHILTVSRRAQGDLFIVAAGDDISHIDRTMETVKAWRSSRAEVIQSHYDEFNDAGDLVAKNLGQRRSATIQKWFNGCDFQERSDYLPTIIGCSAAYERSKLDKLPLNNRKCLNEDAMMTILGILENYKIETIPKVLMFHRRHQENVSSDENARSFKGIKRNEFIKSRFAQSTADFIDYFSEFLLMEGSRERGRNWSIVAQNLLNDRDFLNLHADFWSLHFVGRVESLVRSRTSSEVRFILPRLFGVNFFSLIKLIFGRN
ncbi:glycosyltransferase family 2 protein [Oceaniglobus ichthyenteri]|uniref:glycosyltransferase family 2 protein n=1 Tax=Oceaniglobus ichthyenteri TaxID=2136177 RepID=UPI000D36A639|nr:glycosyltransferase family 2 protein [Oceaniglobus ichthyenteri]